MNSLKLFITLLITATLIQGCVDDEPEVPPVNIPKVDFSANTSIAKLKYDFKKYMDTTAIAIDSIENDVIIKGIVVANDESGNFYKKIVIQDETGGIEVQLDKSSLYNEYRLGQTIFIKCKGLFVGDYRGIVQLGYKYNNSIGRIPEAKIKSHLFIDGLPVALPSPLKISLAALKDTNLNMLCKMDSVYFEQPGVLFAPSTDDATNRTILDFKDNKIYLRTSKYSNFASSKTPYGSGTVVGILSRYSGDWQFYIRDLSDIQNFGGPAPLALINETFDTDPTLHADLSKKWYVYSISSNKNWYWSSQYLAMVCNGYGGDAPSDDWLISPPINLAGCSETKLSFRTWTKYTDAGTSTPISVLVSTDYTSGSPADANWTPLNANWSPTNSQTWTPSGDIDLNAYNNKTIRIAFRYMCTSGSSASTWEVDEVKLKTKK